MRARGHETVEHAADMGIRGWGTSLEEAFEETAEGVLELMVDREGLGGGDGFHISLTGKDLEGLLVDFLNEIISLSDLEDSIFTDVVVSGLSSTHEGWTLEASLSGVPREGREGAILSDVKAVAWYGAEVAGRPGEGWTARCLVDL